jgi:transposase
MQMLAIDETYMSLAEAAKFFPSRPHIATVWRWATKGMKNGIKLDTAMIGGKRYTTEESVAKFLEALNGRPVLSRSTRAKQLAAAEKELDAELA